MKHKYELDPKLSPETFTCRGNRENIYRSLKGYRIPAAAASAAAAESAGAAESAAAVASAAGARKE